MYDRIGIGSLINEHSVPEFQHQKVPDLVLPGSYPANVFVEQSGHDVVVEVTALSRRRVEEYFFGQGSKLLAEPVIYWHTKPHFRPINYLVGQQSAHRPL